MQKFAISSRGGGSIICITGGTQRNERFEGHTSSLFRFFPKTKQKKQKKGHNWFWHVRFGSSLFHKTFPPLPSLRPGFARTPFYRIRPSLLKVRRRDEVVFVSIFLSFLFLPFFLADWLTAEIAVGGGDGEEARELRLPWLGLQFTITGAYTTISKKLFVGLFFAFPFRIVMVIDCQGFRLIMYVWVLWPCT